MNLLKWLNPLYALQAIYQWLNPTNTGHDQAARSRDEIDRDYFVVFYLILIAIALGLLILTMPYWWLAEWSKVATPFLGALACLATGWMTGFLFGIPKTDSPVMTAPSPAPPRNPAAPTAPDGTPTPTSAPEATAIPTPPREPQGDRRASDRNQLRPRVNNNLEQISDWLTKIVVGLGLVELRNIPGYLQSMADALVTDLGWPCNRSYAVAFIVYFAVVGFVHGYLSTRLFLGLAIARADWELNEKMYEPHLDAIWRAVGSQRTEMNVENDALKAQFKLANFELAVSDGLALLGNDNPDEDVLKDVVNKIELERRDFLDDRRSAYVLSELYVRKLENFEAGIRVAEETIEAMRRRGTENTYDLVILHYNLACYHAIRSTLADRTEVEKQADRQKAREELATALRLDPKTAADAARDADLSAVRNEPWFQALVAQPAPPAPPPAPPPVVTQPPTETPPAP